MHVCIVHVAKTENAVLCVAHYRALAWILLIMLIMLMMLMEIASHFTSKVGGVLTPISSYQRSTDNGICPCSS